MKQRAFREAETKNDNGELTMNINRFWPAIALAATLVLTACGGDGSNTPAANNPATPNNPDNGGDDGEGDEDGGDDGGTGTDPDDGG